ncbi:hypothetical protein E1J38_005075 [Seonamhaeicola sediminis]|uniref:Uncharacterized protein n=1 Tax=Seonamhaeicola sediminis TaxID=2528206 RepID=A0A562YEX1_9FLAO|nr:hypothetical protein [Seonamhaeicola sediminis]TWO33270.1 hypothetical protein E1J38_005075 [Seonamhaeicola sediminis]
MKTLLKFTIVIVFCFATCLGCSKDPDIDCGTITDITWSASFVNLSGYHHITVKLPDGSLRYDTVEADSIISEIYKVGDEYCEATRTSR